MKLLLLFTERLGGGTFRGNHLWWEKKPSEVLLSLMVTVSRLAVTSVTRTRSTPLRLGLQVTTSETSRTRVGDGLSRK